jgi:hypothetical protein
MTESEYIHQIETVLGDKLTEPEFLFVLSSLRAGIVPEPAESLETVVCATAARAHQGHGEGSWRDCAEPTCARARALVA